MSAHRKKHPFDFKTQYGLGFNQQDDEIVVDFFCGGGGGGTGTGTGLEMGLGRAVTVAKTQLVHMCGNSVSPPPMAALARANDPWRAIALQAAAA